MIKTPVWQALAVLSWEREILISEVVPKDATVCELNCKVRLHVLGAL